MTKDIYLLAGIVGYTNLDKEKEGAIILQENKKNKVLYNLEEMNTFGKKPFHTTMDRPTDNKDAKESKKIKWKDHDDVTNNKMTTFIISVDPVIGNIENSEHGWRDTIGFEIDVIFVNLFSFEEETEETSKNIKEAFKNCKNKTNNKRNIDKSDSKDIKEFFQIPGGNDNVSGNITPLYEENPFPTNIEYNDVSSIIIKAEKINEYNITIQANDHHRGTLSNVKNKKWLKAINFLYIKEKGLRKIKST